MHVYVGITNQIRTYLHTYIYTYIYTHTDMFSYLQMNICIHQLEFVICRRSGVRLLEECIRTLDKHSRNSLKCFKLSH